MRCAGQRVSGAGDAQQGGHSDKCSEGHKTSPLVLSWRTAEGIPGFKCRGQRAVRVAIKAIEVTHLAAGPRFGFAIQVQPNTGTPERLFPARFATAPEITQ